MNEIPLLNPNSFSSSSFFNSEWLNPSHLFDQGVAFFRQLPDVFNENNAKITLIYDIASIVFFFFTIFFILIISYSLVRIFEIRKKAREHIKQEIARYARGQAEKEKKLQGEGEISKNLRWIQTITYLFSQHESDWKLAIIEADSMLEELMGQLGFKGDNLGDKLKEATQENFRRLSAAWEAHTIRNRVAHEGVNFKLSHHEAKRVIALYEQIFREFGYI